MYHTYIYETKLGWHTPTQFPDNNKRLWYLLEYFPFFISAMQIVSLLGEYMIEYIKTTLARRETNVFPLAVLANISMHSDV